jgi:hypothetical protein
MQYHKSERRQIHPTPQEKPMILIFALLTLFGTLRFRRKVALPAADPINSEGAVS